MREVERRVSFLTSAILSRGSFGSYCMSSRFASLETTRGRLFLDDPSDTHGFPHVSKKRVSIIHSGTEAPFHGILGYLGKALALAKR